ncbi:hypothetical protein JOM56_009412 [Amanita muscaria]
MSMAAADITSFSLSEKQHKKRQKIDKSLETMLEVLNSGTATRLPLVQSAFGSAARISQISQKVRSNQDKFVELAEQSCRLVYSIYVKLTNEQEIEQSLKHKLEGLLETLQSIQTFGEKCAARGTVKAVLLHGVNIKKLKSQRRKLEGYIQLFEFQSPVDLREKTNQLVERHRTPGSVCTTRTNTNNSTENKRSSGKNSNFEGANGKAINHNHNRGGVGQSSTNTDNANNGFNSISFGANNYNSNNRTGNLFSSDRAADIHGNAQSNHQCASAADLNNITPTDIKFGDGGNFTCSNGGADNQNSSSPHRLRQSLDWGEDNAWDSASDPAIPPLS